MTTEVASRVEPQRWAHRRNLVEAMHYDGTEQARRTIAAWVTAGGGEALVRATGDLLVLTRQGWLPVHVGWWVANGGWWHLIDPEVAAVNYESAGPSFLAIVDRDTAAAMVVGADNFNEHRGEVSVDTLGVMISTLTGYIHQLAATVEALR